MEDHAAAPSPQFTVGSYADMAAEASQMLYGSGLDGGIDFGPEEEVEENGRVQDEKRVWPTENEGQRGLAEHVYEERCEDENEMVSCQTTLSLSLRSNADFNNEAVLV